ncbi:MAG: hypothetical protein SGARI_008031, partial [Bacillariaceae sp.]
MSSKKVAPSQASSSRVAAASLVDSSEYEPAKKKAKVVAVSLDTLPAAAMTTIGKNVGDFKELLNLGHTNSKLMAVLHDSYQCAKCTDHVFLVKENEDAANNASHGLSLPDQAKPFFCGVCGKVFCGQTGTDKRFCRPRPPCPGCGKIECHSCMIAHAEDCGFCGRYSDGYCEECQGGFDENRFCDLCNFGFCQHHGDRCDHCGVKTC